MIFSLLLERDILRPEGLLFPAVLVAFLLYGLVPACVTAVIVAYPLHKLLESLGRVGLPWYLIMGAVAGAPVAALFGLEHARGQVRLMPGMFWTLIAGGAFGAAAFWLVRRPDRFG